MSSTKYFSQALTNALACVVVGGIGLHFLDHDVQNVRVIALFALFLASIMGLGAAFYLLSAVAVGLVTSIGSAGGVLSPLMRLHLFQKIACGIVAFFIAAVSFIGVDRLMPTTLQWTKFIGVFAALAVFYAPNIAAWTITRMPIVREWGTGGKPSEKFGGWIALRRMAGSFDGNMFRGYFSRKLYVGHTLRSHYGRSAPAFLDTDVSRVTFAATGSGKAISDLYHLALYLGDLVAISTKSDLVDAMLGARCDVDYWFHKGRAEGEKLMHPGVDPCDITNAKYHLRRGRVMLNDPDKQSIAGKAGRGSTHAILSEIDVTKPNAAELILAVALASNPFNDRATEDFWQNTERGLIASGIGHVLTTPRDPSQRTMPYVRDFLLGIDESGNADPEVFQKRLQEMLKNPALNGLVQTGASAVDELGPNAYGGVTTGVKNALRWTSFVGIQEQISGTSDYSYTETGDPDRPLTIFTIAPNTAPTETAAYMRTHAALFMALRRSMPRPKHNILFACDEFRQWGKGIDQICSGAMELRSFGIKLLLWLQNYSALVTTVGSEEKAHEICSSSSEVHYGVGLTDKRTQQRISDLMGMKTVNGYAYPVISPQDAAQVLGVLSNQKLVFPYGGVPVLVERRAHKSLRTKEGLRIRGLRELGGLIDDHFGS